MAGSLTYVKGDATQPAGDGPKFIIHVCNDLGRWGAGFVMALSRRWPEPQIAYYAYAEEAGCWPLGHTTKPVLVEENLWVINMIAQRGIGKRFEAAPPIRYKAVRNCLKDVATNARNPAYKGDSESVSIHCPKFGAGLAGGDWRVIEQLIQEELVDKGLSVTVYEFDG